MSQERIPFFELYPGASDDPLAHREKPRLLLAGVLFLVSFCTTLVAGFFWHVQFISESMEEVRQNYANLASDPFQILHGLYFSLTLLAILMAHELGHYVACRYYRIRATLPYVIPSPPPWSLDFFGNPFGTFGAVIRIKSPFRNPRQLFDVGIAGPLAGFLVIIPALLIGLSYSQELTVSALPDPSDGGGITFYFPLLFQLGANFLSLGPGLKLHPIAWAAWFGALATGINLLPVSQLDGGHVIYALLGGRWHRRISYTTLGGLIFLGFYSFPSSLMYLVFALVILLIGLRHPQPLQPTRLGPARILLALAGLLIFVLTFMPVPIRIHW